MPSRNTLVAVLVVGWSGLTLAVPLCADDPARNLSPVKSETTIGVAGKLDSVVLPGSELEVAPQTDRQPPLMLRIVNTWKHGDSYRYDLEYIGLEAGDYDLGQFLSRTDATESGELPPVLIRVRAQLPPGQVLPHEIAIRWPAVMSYRFWACLAVGGWVLGLIGLIAWKRKGALAAAAEARPKTFAELLAPRLAAASSGELNSIELAELERFVVEFWRRRLKLNEVPVHQAISQLRSHAQAGPLLQQLEQWMHAPRQNAANGNGSPTESASLGTLLEPYRKFPLELELEPKEVG